MSTVQEVSDYVTRIFGDESGVQVNDEDIYRWTNAAQREILNANKILKTIAITDLLAGKYEYDVSDLKILEIQSIHFNGTKLDYRSFQEAEEYILSSDPQRTNSGQPFMWYEWARTINVYPKPDADYLQSLKIYYVQGPTKVTTMQDELSVPDEYFNRVVEFVLAQAYEMDEDSQNSDYKLGQFNNNLMGMTNTDNQPAMDTYPRITILPEDM